MVKIFFQPLKNGVQVKTSSELLHMDLANRFPNHIETLVIHPYVNSTNRMLNLKSEPSLQNTLYTGIQ